MYALMLLNMNIWMYWNGLDRIIVQNNEICIFVTKEINSNNHRFKFDILINFI